MDDTQFGIIRSIGNGTDDKQTQKNNKPSNCPDINAFAGYLDNNLVEAEKNTVEQHMATCGTCRTNLYEVKMLLDQEPKATPDELADNVKKNLQQAFSTPTQGRGIKT